MNVRELIVAYLKANSCDGLRRGEVCICFKAKPFMGCDIFAGNGECRPFHLAESDKMVNVPDEDEDVRTGQDRTHTLSTPPPESPYLDKEGVALKAEALARHYGKDTPAPKQEPISSPAPVPPPVPLAQPAKRPGFLAKERCQVCGQEKGRLYMTNCMVCGKRICQGCAEEIQEDVPLCPACAGQVREAKK